VFPGKALELDENASICDDDFVRTV